MLIPFASRTLRLYSLIAYKAVAGSQLSSIPADRANFSAVTLLMAIVWLTNSLHATPDTGPSSRQLLSAVLPHRPLVGMPEVTMPYRLAGTRPHSNDRVEDEGDDDEDREVANDIVRRPSTRRFPALEEDEESDEDDEDEGAVAVRTGPSIPFGLVFLREVIWTKNSRIPLFSSAQFSMLKETVFEYFSGMAWGDFVDKIYTGVLFKPRSITRTRTNTKQRPVVPEEGKEIPVVFALKNGHKKIPKPEWKGGDIVRRETEEVEQVSRNEYLSLIYHQLFVDAICLSPSPRGGGGSYTKIDVAHRSKVTVEVFKDRNPGRAFHLAHMRWGSDKDWTFALSHIIPPQGKLKMESSQNYPQCAYYRMWGHFISSIRSTTAVSEAREAFVAKFLSEVSWFAWAKAERLWESSGKPYKESTHSPGLKADAPGPWLLIRCGCFWKEDEVWTPPGTELVSYSIFPGSGGY